jgi:hypothetical protein
MCSNGANADFQFDFAYTVLLTSLQTHIKKLITLHISYNNTVRNSFLYTYFITHYPNVYREIAQSKCADRNELCILCNEIGLLYNKPFFEKFVKLYLSVAYSKECIN